MPFLNSKAAVNE